MFFTNKATWKDIFYIILLIFIQYALIAGAFLSAVGTAEEGHWMYSAVKIIESGYNDQIFIKSNGPLYQLWYIPFLKLFGGPYAYHLNSIFLSIVTALLLYLFFRKNTSPLFAFLLCSFAIFSIGLYQENWLIFRFGFSVCMVGIVVYLYSATILDYSLALLIIYLSSFARNEYIIVFVILLLYLLYKMYYKKIRVLKISKTLFIKVSLIIVLLMSVLMISHHSSVRTHTDVDMKSRLWRSFSQFYTTNVISYEKLESRDSSLVNKDIMERDFPGANSILDAVQVNPFAFGRHVLQNVRLFFMALLKYYRPVCTFPKFKSVKLQNETFALFAFHILVLFYLLLIAIYLLENSEKRTNSKNDLRVLSFALACVILPIFVLMPKTSYIIPLMPLVIVAVGELLEKLKFKIQLSPKGVAWFMGYRKTQYVIAILILFMVVAINKSLFVNREGQNITNYLMRGQKSYNIVAVFPGSYAASLYPRKTKVFNLGDYFPQQKSPLPTLLQNRLNEPELIIIKSRPNQWPYLPKEVRKLVELRKKTMILRKFNYSVEMYN